MVEAFQWCNGKTPDLESLPHPNVSHALGRSRPSRTREIKKSEGLLPPGQSLTLKWPVLHYGSVPEVRSADLGFSRLRTGGVTAQTGLERVQRSSRRFSAQRLPLRHPLEPLRQSWDGVAFRELLARVHPKPEASYVLIHAEQGYTANVPLADLDREEVLTGNPSRRRALTR